MDGRTQGPWSERADDVLVMSRREWWWVSRASLLIYFMLCLVAIYVGYQAYDESQQIGRWRQAYCAQDAQLFSFRHPNVTAHVQEDMAACFAEGDGHA